MYGILRQILVLLIRGTRLAMPMLQLCLELSKMRMCMTYTGRFGTNTWADTGALIQFEFTSSWIRAPSRPTPALRILRAISQVSQLYRRPRPRLQCPRLLCAQLTTSPLSSPATSSTRSNAESISVAQTLVNRILASKSLHSKTAWQGVATGTHTTPQTYAVASPIKSATKHATGSEVSEVLLLMQATTVLD